MNEVYYKIRYEALVATVRALTTSSESVIIDQLVKAMNNADFRAHIKEGVLPYLYAAGFLSFAGREIERDSLVKIIKAIGMTPNDKMVDAVMNANIKSHLVYVYAFYFLVANGKETSEANISEVVKALGMQPDKSRITDIRDFLLVP